MTALQAAFNNFVEKFIRSTDTTNAEDIMTNWMENSNQEAMKNMILSTLPTTKKPKDKEAPKAPKSAYLIFCDEKRKEVTERLEEEEDYKPSDVMVELGKLWNNLKSKTKYEKEAKQDERRYKAEQKDYKMSAEYKEKCEKWEKLNPQKLAGKKKPRDPEAPKNALTAYQLFCQDQRKETKSISMKELGSEWKKLKNSKSKSDKKMIANYNKKALKEKKRYEEEMKQYKPSEEFLAKTRKWEAANPDKAKKASKKSNKPKNAWNFFYTEMNQKLKEEIAVSAERRAEISRLWKEEYPTVDDRQKWIDLAAEDKERYEQENSNSDNSESDNEKTEKKRSVKKTKTKRQVPTSKRTRKTKATKNENKSDNEESESENSEESVKKVTKRKPKSKKVSKKPKRKVGKSNPKTIAQFQTELDKIDTDFESSSDSDFEKEE